MISEEDLESDVIVPDILPESRFQVMVKDANLDESRANYLLQNFSSHFKEAAEWARKAKDIIVTNENQTVMMDMARTGRLFLAKKRQEIEKARKWMKEPALREGQAIDRIANLLKDTIIPTEQHLERQEKFIEFRDKAEKERIQAEVEKKFEENRIAKEKSDSEERERLITENERLLLKQKIAEEVAEKFRIEQEEKLQEERNKTLIIECELQIRKQEELKKEADKIRAEEALASAGDEEKLLKLREDLLAIKIPEVKSVQANRITAEAISYIYLATKNIKPRIVEE